jgi:hypothetical protein
MDTTTAVQPSLTSVAVNTCPVCAASLAEDQRYCVECGERCGGPRLPAPHEKAAAAVAERASSRRRVTAGTTLVAGVATLLLAMGVGILIGRQNKTSAENTAARSPVQVVTVGGGGAAPAAAAAATAAHAAATHKPSAKAKKAATKKASSSAVVDKILKPTKKAGKLPPATVKLGSKGSGRGYKNGKFTGDFFGGGN